MTLLREDHNEHFIPLHVMSAFKPDFDLPFFICPGSLTRQTAADPPSHCGAPPPPIVSGHV